MSKVHVHYDIRTDLWLYETRMGNTVERTQYTRSEDLLQAHPELYGYCMHRPEHIATIGQHTPTPPRPVVRTRKTFTATGFKSPYMK